MFQGGAEDGGGVASYWRGLRERGRRTRGGGSKGDSPRPGHGREEGRDGPREQVRVGRKRTRGSVLSPDVAF